MQQAIPGDSKEWAQQQILKKFKTNAMLGANQPPFGEACSSVKKSVCIQ
jgi:hypothetical protein